MTTVWVFLSNQLIRSFLRRQNLNLSINQFYRKCLFPNYVNKIDYKEISSDDDIMRDYYRSKKFKRERRYFMITLELKNKMKSDLFLLEKSINKMNEISIINRFVEAGATHIPETNYLITNNEIIFVVLYKLRMDYPKIIDKVCSSDYHDKKRTLYLYENFGETDEMFDNICKTRLNVSVRYHK